MTDVERILRAASSVVVVDWPSKDVPETLARAGYAVIVKGGPGPDSYRPYTVRDGEIVVGDAGPAPEHIDLVYSHRPPAETPAIVALARQCGAAAIWSQSGLAAADVRDPKGCWVPAEESRQARRIAEVAGLAYVDGVYIADLVRDMGIRRT